MAYIVCCCIRGGRWVARSVEAGFIILGVLVFLGIIEIPSGGMEEEASKENTALRTRRILA